MKQVMEGKDLEKVHVQCDRMSGSVLPLEAPIEPGGILPFQERYAQWYRWSYAAAAYRDKQAAVNAFSSPDLIHYEPADARILALKAAKHLFPAWIAKDQKANAAHLPHWQRVENRELQAFMGFLAHPADPKIGAKFDKVRATKHPDAKHEKEALEAAFRTVMQTPRNLLTGVPDLWARLKSVITKTPQLHNYLLIRLKPLRVISHQMQDLRIFPELELTFSADEQTQTTTLASVRFVRAWRESHLLLPAQASDLRFVARSLIRSSDEIDPAVLDFVANSQLDIFGDGLLHTPGQMALEVPRFACKRWPTAAAHPGSTTPAAGDPAAPALDATPSAAYSASAESLLVDYSLASLEHYSSLRTTYQGHALQYSTVEAGRTGGRREELRFDLPDLPMKGLGHRASAGRQLYLDWFDSVREFNSRLFK
jgi:hypothetical protein